MTRPPDLLSGPSIGPHEMTSSHPPAAVSICQWRQKQTRQDGQALESRLHSFRQGKVGFPTYRTNLPNFMQYTKRVMMWWEEYIEGARLQVFFNLLDLYYRPLSLRFSSHSTIVTWRLSCHLGHTHKWPIKLYPGQPDLMHPEIILWYSQAFVSGGFACIRHTSTAKSQYSKDEKSRKQRFSVNLSISHPVIRFVDAVLENFGFSDILEQNSVQDSFATSPEWHSSQICLALRSLHFDILELTDKSSWYMHTSLMIGGRSGLLSMQTRLNCTEKCDRNSWEMFQI